MEQFSDGESLGVQDRPTPSEHLQSLLGDFLCEREYSATEEERQLIAWLERAADLPGKTPVRLAILIQKMAAKYGRKIRLTLTKRQI